MQVVEKLIQIQYVLQIGAKLLQIGAAPLVTNSSISYISRQNSYKLGQLLQIGAELLKIGAVITNWGNYYKSVQNTSARLSHLKH